MPVVRLRAPLSELAGGHATVAVDGRSVAEALAALEQLHPALSGWIRDERGEIRVHVNIFVNGHISGLETPLGPDDRVHVLPAITGGA